MRNVQNSVCIIWMCTVEVGSTIHYAIKCFWVRTQWDIVLWGSSLWHHIFWQRLIITKNLRKHHAISKLSFIISDSGYFYCGTDDLLAFDLICLSSPNLRNGFSGCVSFNFKYSLDPDAQRKTHTLKSADFYSTVLIIELCVNSFSVIFHNKHNKRYCKINT